MALVFSWLNFALRRLAGFVLTRSSYPALQSPCARARMTMQRETIEANPALIDGPRVAASSQRKRASAQVPGDSRPMARSLRTHARPRIGGGNTAHPGGPSVRITMR